MSYVTKQKLSFMFTDALVVETTAVLEFQAVKFGSDTTKCVPCDPNDADAIGYAHFATAVGRSCDVMLNNAPMIMRAKVASGQTATAGKLAVGVTGGGFKNAPALTSGSTLSMVCGKFFSSGTNGDEVSLLTCTPYPIFTA